MCIPARSRNRKASPELRQRVSANLKRLRQARGYTQEELATLCHVSKNYIGNVEQGRLNITLATIEMFAKALRVPEEALFKPLPPRGH